MSPFQVLEIHPLPVFKLMRKVVKLDSAVCNSASYRAKVCMLVSSAALKVAREAF